jgi:hypothetical protein
MKSRVSQEHDEVVLPHLEPSMKTWRFFAFINLFMMALLCFVVLDATIKLDRARAAIEEYDTELQRQYDIVDRLTEQVVRQEQGQVTNGWQKRIEALTGNE